MKLILARHGETEENVKHVLMGKSGGKLSENGIKQAKNLGKHLKENHKIDMVFCSPLDRCVETLEHILSEYPIEGEIIMSKLLEERDFGEYTGLEASLVDWEEFEKNEKDEKRGVENFESVKKRVHLFLEDLKLENSEATVLVLSHSEPIKAMVSKISGKDVEEIKIENATPLVFEKFE